MIAQIVDLLAIVQIEISLHLPDHSAYSTRHNAGQDATQKNDGQNGGQQSEQDSIINGPNSSSSELEMTLQHLLDDGQLDLYIARLAVAARILERSRGRESNTGVLETFGQRWCEQLTDLLTTQTAQDTAIGIIGVGTPAGVSGTSSVLVGTLEHHRRKDNREIYWTSLTLGNVLRCLHRDGVPEDKTETLDGSVLINSSQHWKIDDEKKSEYTT